MLVYREEKICQGDVERGDDCFKSQKYESNLVYRQAGVKIASQRSKIQFKS